MNNLPLVSFHSMPVQGRLVLFSVLSAFAMLLPFAGSGQQALITVDAGKVQNNISDLLYGSCIEDVNHEIYGGLFDQRLYGESFEEPPFEEKPPAGNGAAPIGQSPLQAVSSMWDIVWQGAAGSRMSLDSIHAFNGRQSQVVEHGTASGRFGIANRGLNRWGITLLKGQVFSGYVYLHSGWGRPSGPVTIALQSVDGSKTYAEHKINRLTGSWTKYSFRLEADASDTNARFTIYLDQPGKIWIDQAALFSPGKKPFNKIPIRSDIGMKMMEEGLRFVRYGGSMVNAPGYRWKKMIGDPAGRPPYKGWWYPYSSNGFGIEDFLQFAEAAEFEAAFAVNIEETDQDMADLADYLKGDLTTEWGKKRAANGHPQPYKVRYIEIGNEEVIGSDDTKAYDHYVERFTAIYQLMHDRYPEIKLINAAWWRPHSGNMERVFKALDGKAAYWDLHVWADDARAGLAVDTSLGNMQDLFLRWNPKTTMKCTIFEENGKLHNQQRALGHATIQNAVRRHGDFVLTSCAANGLQALHENDNGWDQGQIFYTSGQVYGMPPFYAQQMASLNHLPLRVAGKAEGDLDVTATRSSDGKTLVLHVVNTNSVSVKARVLLNNFPDRSESVRSWELAAAPTAENAPDEIPAVSTKESAGVMPRGTDTFTFQANSYTILRFTR